MGRASSPVLRLLVALAVAIVPAAACAGPGPDVVRIDGSSTLYPLTEAVAEDYLQKHPEARVTIGVSGTGGGLKRLCRREIEVAGASRPMSASERATCAREGTAFLEIPVAYDGITVVVHPANTWVDALSVDELGRLWRHDAQNRVLHWSDLRDGLPRRPLRLYGAGVDSGTFDYFTEAVTGTARDSRGDFTASEDDNLLVDGVAGDRDGLGFFGFAYFDQHRSRLRAVPIRSGPGAEAVTPSRATIASGAYRPLTRPVFLYVHGDAFARPLVRDFLRHYVARTPDLAPETGFVPLSGAARARVEDRLARGVEGSLYADVPATTPLDVRLEVE